MDEKNVLAFLTRAIQAGKQRSCRNTHQSEVLHYRCPFSEWEVEGVQIFLAALVFRKLDIPFDIVQIGHS